MDIIENREVSLMGCLETITRVSHFRGLSIHPFCNKVKRDPLQTECTDDRTSVALCNLVRHENPLPELYQVITFVDFEEWCMISSLRTLTRLDSSKLGLKDTTVDRFP